MTSEPTNAADVRPGMETFKSQTSAYDVILDKYKATILGQGDDAASGSGNSLLDVIDDITYLEAPEDLRTSNRTLEKNNSRESSSDEDSDDDEISEVYSVEKRPENEEVSQPVSLDTLKISQVNLPPQPDFGQLDTPSPPSQNAQYKSNDIYTSQPAQLGYNSNAVTHDTEMGHEYGEGSNYDERAIAKRRLLRRTYIFCWFVVAGILVALVTVLLLNRTQPNSTPAERTTPAPNQPPPSPDISPGLPPTSARPISPSLPPAIAPPSTTLAPTLSSVSIADKARAKAITQELLKVTNEELLADQSSAQYLAKEWLIYEDPLRVPSDYNGLTQRYILATLYFSTLGDEWKKCKRAQGQSSELCDNGNSYTFLSGVTECEWFGVECARIFAFVTSINLDDNKLRGEIPSEIASLPQLHTLSLNGNRLAGSLPANLKNLTRLEQLSIGNNNFVGKIPHDMFSPLLRYLDLEANKLSGVIPDDLFQSIELTQVDLSKNELSGTINPKWGNLTKLSTLNLEANKFQGTLPGEIFTKAIRVFSIANNNVSGTIPDGIFNSLSLEYLDLGVNSFNGTISSRFGEFKTMKYLVLYMNKLSGQIPKEIGNMSSLMTFQSPYNLLTGVVPGEVCALTPKPLETLWADCKAGEGGEAPKVECTCNCLCFTGY